MDRNLQQRLGAGQQVGQYEGLQDQNIADLSQFSDDPYRNLSRYSNLLQMSPIMSSAGNSKSKGFSL